MNVVARPKGEMLVPCGGNMEFPDAARVDGWLEDVTYPPFARVSYHPETPELDDVEAATHEALATLDLDALDGKSVAIGVGSRGIAEIDTVAATTVEVLQDAGASPYAIPAMGSHGGATAAGQREVLAQLDITEDRLGCPIDARMDTTVIGEADVGGKSIDVNFAKSALEADAVLPINRVKVHTLFTGPNESGVCKMLVVGMGKQPGARTLHRNAFVHDFQAMLEASMDVIRREVPVVGGVAIVENFVDEPAHVKALPVETMVTDEQKLLERSREYLATLPYDEVDILVVDEIGKNISGTGMDTNVVGRRDIYSELAPTVPAIHRVYVRGLTEQTHGNANGMGFADAISAAVAEEIDFTSTYANAITSGTLSNVRMPIVMPSDEQALPALVGTLGGPAPDALRVAWIENTGELGELYATPAQLAETDDQAVEVLDWHALSFEDGTATFSPSSPPSGSARED